MYQIGDYVVCPGHGVGQITNIDLKNLAGVDKSFYIIKIVANGMTIMVPTESKDGVRGLVSQKEIDDVFVLLGEQDVKVDNSTWNRRHREYVAKVKTGSLLEIADVLRQLLLLKVSKKLSFGEKKMLEQCRDLIVKEVALASGIAEKDITGKIENLYSLDQ